jgi:Ca2+-binding RTX toxin-like protein
MHRNTTFELEVLEARLLLSGDSLGAVALTVDMSSGDQVLWSSTENVSEPGKFADDSNSSAPAALDLFGAGQENAVELRTLTPAVASSSEPSAAPEGEAVEQAAVCADVLSQQGNICEDAGFPASTPAARSGPSLGAAPGTVAALSLQSGDSLHTAQGPPTTELIGAELTSYPLSGLDPQVVDEDEILTSTGPFSSGILNHGTLSPSGTGGIGITSIQNGFTQEQTGKIVIQIGGLGGPGDNLAPRGNDAIAITGDATLAGSIELELVDGFIPTAGQSFDILSWTGNRTGEIASWLGTSGIPGRPQLAFVPDYDDGLKVLSVQVVSTQTILPSVQAQVENLLERLEQLGNQLDGLGAFAESIPFLGGALGNLVDAGNAIKNAIRDPLAEFLDFLPRQAEVTAEIESWDGANKSGFVVGVKGVRGHYGATTADPFWWDIQIEITQTHLNQALTDLAASGLGALFDPNPTVTVKGTLELDFSIGYDATPFVAIRSLTARAVVDVDAAGGFFLDLIPVGSPVTFDVTAWTVNLDASVTATPDDSILTGGRITLATLSALSPANLSDAFNLEEAGILDASLTLNGSISLPGIAYTGVHRAKIHSGDLFNGRDPDVTLVIDGSLTVLNQSLQGVFTLRKTATETLIEAEQVVLDLKVGVGALERRVLLAENGTAKFLLVGGNQLAGTASLTITQGPNLPNLDISGTSLTLTLNTSSAAVATIDGEAVDLPAGPYYRVAGNAVIRLDVPGVDLQGDFVFAPFDPTPGAPSSGDEVINVGVSNLAFSLAGPGGALLSITGGSGLWVITPQGMQGAASATAALSAPGLSLTGTFYVALNDLATPLTKTLEVNGTSVTVDLPAGPVIQVEARDARLDVLGVKLTGTFFFQQKRTGDGDQVITVGLNNVVLPLGTLTSDIVTASITSGLFILRDGGMAGEADATLAVAASTAFTLAGTFKVRINESNGAVSESVAVNGTPYNINLPAGPYLQVRGSNVVIGLLGLQLQGNVAVTQRASNGGTQLVVVAVSNLSLDFGTDILRLRNGTGLFVLTDTGSAGTAAIDLELSAFGESFSQPVTYAFNSMPQAISEVVTADDLIGAGSLALQSSRAGKLSALTDLLQNLNLPSGPFNRLETHGPVSFSFPFAGRTQSFQAELVLTLVDGGPSPNSDYVTVGVSQLQTNFGAGPVAFNLANGTGALVIKNVETSPGVRRTGVAGRVTIGSASLTGIPTITLGSSALAIEFNNLQVDLPSTVVPISSNPAENVTLQFAGPYYRDYVAVTGTADLTLLNLFTMGGQLRIEKSEAAPGQLKLAVQELHLSLKAGSYTVASFHHGTGYFVIGSSGIAGRAALEFEVGMIGISGSINLELNTTGAAVNTTIATPTTPQSLNLAAGNYARVVVSGQLHLGSLVLPFDFSVRINTGTGAVEFFNTSDVLLIRVNPNGSIETPGISLPLDDFAAPGPFELVSMLRQLGSWLAMFKDASIFDVEIPFTGGTTLGDALDWSQGFLDSIYSKMVSIELQSSTLVIPEGQSSSYFTGTLTDVRMKLQIGTADPAELIIAGPTSYSSLDQLVSRFNTAIGSVAALNGVVEARINKNRQFVIALKKDEDVARSKELKLVDLNAAAQALGFNRSDGNYGDTGDVTAEQVAVVSARYDTDAFFEALGDLLGPEVTYNPITRVYTYTANIGYLHEFKVPFKLGGQLGDIASASLAGQINVKATLGAEFTLGFDLGAREVPRIISSTTLPVPSNGRISEDAHFTIYLNNSPVGINFTLPRSVTLDNSSIGDLAKDLNDLFALPGKTFEGTQLNRLLYAQKAGSSLAISVLQEDADGDGALGTHNEDLNFNGEQDPTEADTDGDGYFDHPEDLNGNGIMDNQLGIINKVVILSLANDVFATELGFGQAISDDDPNTPLDNFMVSASTTGIKGLFVEGVKLTAKVEVSTPTPISGSLRFGFVEVSTSGGKLETKDLNGVNKPIEFNLALQDRTTGNSRLYLAELFRGLRSDALANLTVTPQFKGSFLAKLDNISVGGLGFSLPLGSNPEISIFVPDITDLSFNSSPYNGSNTGIFLTYPDLSSLANFAELNFATIVRALKAIADNLSKLSAFGFLDEPLPLVNVSINDMLNYAQRFADLVDRLGRGNASSLQQTVSELKRQIDELFNLDPDILTIVFDQNGLPAASVTSGGVNITSHASVTFNPAGPNNGFVVRTSSLTTSANFNNVTLRVVGNSNISGSSAQAEWNASTRQILVKINPGVTTANAVVSAVNALTGSPWTASLVANDASGNTGNGVLRTNSLKFSLQFSTAYANTLPFQLDLNKLVGQLAGDDGAIAAFLDAVTTFIQVEGSGVLSVSAGANLQLDFGLDLTNPSSVKPFFYDTTGATLTAKVLGTDIEFQAAMGGVLGIWVKGGSVTIDADGNPDTGAAQGDKGAFIRLGFNDNNGDGRHYFDEDWFDGSSINLTMDGGITAILPVFAPTEFMPLGGDADADGNGYPDNQLVIDIPDLVRLFVDKSAVAGKMTLRLPGGQNDLEIKRTSGTPANFKVVLVENDALGQSAQAAFSNNVLTLTVDSDETRASDIKAAIESQTSGFTVTHVKDNDLPANGSGKATTSKLKLYAPDLSSLFDNLDLCDVINSLASPVIKGLDSFLGKIEDGLNSFVYSTRLPLIGDGLGGVANFISSFRNGLLRDLQKAIDEAGGSATTALENAIKKAFWNLLGPEGLDLLVQTSGNGLPLDPALGWQQLDVRVNCEDGLVVNLRLKKEIALVDTTANPIDFDIGVPGFGLEVNGNVQIALGFDLKLGFGFNKEDGFYFNSSAPSTNPELRIYFEAKIPGLSATGTLLFLQLEIADDDRSPTQFVGQFAVDLRDPNSDGKLTFAEITSSGTQFGDVIDYRLEAVADVNLVLIASFGGNTAFPRVLADFSLYWRWDLKDGAQTPRIEFKNLRLDLGSFLGDFLAPILKEIRKVTEPVQPIIDVVTAKLPILSELAGRKITLLDLAEVFGLLEPSTRVFIEDILSVISLINKLEGLGEGTILIPLGSFSLSDDGSGQMRNIGLMEDLGRLDLGSQIASGLNTGPGTSQTFVNQTAGFASDIGALSNFSIPIFDNPSEIFNLFIGESVRLVEWRMPQFKFEFEYVQRIPIYPPLYAQFGGRLGATIDIGFGYDTYGIQKYISSEAKNWVDILDGFYVIDFDANGNERPELTLYGELFAGVSINLGLIEVGVKGGVYAKVEFDLNDVNDDGRVRVSEIIANAQQDPRCIFNIHGEIGVFLEAFLKVDLFFFSIDKTWRFGEFVLFEFDVNCPEPVLAEKVGGDLVLNVGSRAGKRLEIDTNDNAETFIVKHTGGSAGSETVEVAWGNYTAAFDGIARIVVEDAGQGNDVLDFRGVLSKVEVKGGVGDDTIYLSDGDGSKAWGGAGNDTIIASGVATALNVEIWGDDGNDILTGGTKAIIIHGGAGNDTITGTPEADRLYGDAGDDTILALDGDDIAEGGDGNDVIDGGAGNDWLVGGKGADKLRGGRGDDFLDGGDGPDELLGSSGNDLLVGGSGDDFMNGHGGIDLLIGDQVGKVASLALIPTNWPALRTALAAIPASGIKVDDLSGSGNDLIIGGGNIDVLFGGQGDDFLYGGNYLNAGDTEPIEEDGNDFFDGGPGNDTIFGDDAQGKTGDRNTGISIKSSVWYDWNQDGLRDSSEKGVGGVTVTLYDADNDDVLDVVKTSADGTFEFKGLDPLDYYMGFSGLPTGTSFTTKFAGGATQPDQVGNDSDVNLTGTFAGKTNFFNVTYNETKTSVSAGLVGPSTVSVSDVSLKEGNAGTTMAVFSVKLSGPQGFRIEVDYTTGDGTATVSAGDYTKVTGALVFNPGELEKTVSVPVHGDTAYETEFEQFQLKVTRAQIMRPIGPTNLNLVTALGTIIDDDPVPQLSVRDYTPVKGAKEGDDAVFVVSMSNPSKFPVTFEYRTDTAITFDGLNTIHAATPQPFPKADYVPKFGTVTIQPGQVNETIVVKLIDDSLDEHDEHFFLDIFNPVNARIADGRGYGIIPDDDAPVSVGIVPVNPRAGEPFTTEVIEGNAYTQQLKFRIVLSKESGKQILVTYATAPGTAQESVPSTSAEWIDYESTPNPDEPDHVQRIIINPGLLQSAEFAVEVYGDTYDEEDEIFFVNILSAENANIAANPLLQSNHATIVIKDDDTGAPTDTGPWNVRFSSSHYYLKEPQSFLESYIPITLIRAPGSSYSSVVLYTEGGTATPGVDYEPIFRRLVTFEENEYIKTVYVVVYDDNITEGEETIRLFLRNPTGGPVKGAPDSAILHIDDSDLPKMWIEPPQMPYSPINTWWGPSIKVFGITEGTGPGSKDAEFTVFLSSPAGPGGVTVHYETVNLSARSGEDYTAVSGTLVIATGQTKGIIKVPVRMDSKAEITERFVVRLANATNATLATRDSTAILPIFDDDKKEISGVVFYDRNGNGFQDLGESGIKDVTVMISWEENGQTTVPIPVKTDGNGLYKTNVMLGPVSIVVDGTTVKSPYQGKFIWFLALGDGNYELTTNNDTQTVEFEGVVGISPFSKVGYTTSFTFTMPSQSKDVGRGGTDDMIFGGPGNDVIDAGAGDDHVVGGHWMTATDSFMPVNGPSYDAVVTATTKPPVTLPLIYDSGPIFSVDASGVPASGKISGKIWIDANGNNRFDVGEKLLTGADFVVVVNLYDCTGNPVNALFTTNGKYEFTGLAVPEDGTDAEYVLEFVLPQGLTFVSPGIGAWNTNSDVYSGTRTKGIAINFLDPAWTEVDAGVRPADFVPALGANNIRFAYRSYNASENSKSGYVEVLLARGSSFAGRSVVVEAVRPFGPLPADHAQPGVNYLPGKEVFYFDVGDLLRVAQIPILDSNTLTFCDNLYFDLNLYDATGRFLDTARVYIYGDGAGTLTDDDTIDGGGDWDIIIGDSGIIDPRAVIEDRTQPTPLPNLKDNPNLIKETGGVGHDYILGGKGNGPDYIRGQLGNDILAGGRGEDVVWGGMGDDEIWAEAHNDYINGEFGWDRVVSIRDIAKVTLESFTATSAVLDHIDSEGLVRSSFDLFNIEEAHLVGGYGDNVFELRSWVGSAYIGGGLGQDTLLVSKNADMKVVHASPLERVIFEIFYGRPKDSAISLSNGLTYHLSGLEVIHLQGGTGANVLDASAFTRPVILEGLGGDDTLRGGSAADRFLFDADSPLGTDTVEGNGGRDTLDFSATSLRVVADMSLLAPTAQTVNANLRLVLEDKIENLTGGGGDDELIGNDLDNVLVGGPGNDVLKGKAGNEIYMFDGDVSYGWEEIHEDASDPGHDVLDFSRTTNRSITINLALQNSDQDVVPGNLLLSIVGVGIEEVIGGSKGDVIRGNSQNNILRGGPGDDLLDGNSGDDLLDGGPGNDTLDGGPGNDTIRETANTNFTLSNSQLIRSNGEVDKLKSIEVAHLRGGSSANTFTLDGWTGTGSLTGGVASASSDTFDTLIVAADEDIMLTNLMLDLFSFSGPMALSSIEVARLSGGPSDNTINASGFTGRTVISGGEGNDTLIGGSGADIIRGGLGNDTLTGNAGNDQLDGGPGTDRIVETRDAFLFSIDARRLLVDPSAGTAGDDEVDDLSGIELVTLIGGPGINFFDASQWTGGPVQIDGAGGLDLVRVLASGHVVLKESGPGSASLEINGNVVASLKNIELAWIEGGPGNDILDASLFGGVVALYGKEGNDTLIGGRGFDYLDGGPGDDLFVFEPNGVLDRDTVVGGPGNDTLDFSFFTAPVLLDLSATALTQLVVAGELRLRLLDIDIENVVGGDGADWLIGNALDNKFTGGPGNDIIEGGGGIDEIVEQRDDDFTLTNLSLGIGIEIDSLSSIERATLTGGSGDNLIDASAFSGSVTLRGLGGADILIGGGGDDILEGGAGDDSLEGGAGNDRYVFNVDEPLGSDKVYELPGAAGGQDTLDFSGAHLNGIDLDLGLASEQIVHSTNLRLTLNQPLALEVVFGTQADDFITGNSLNNVIWGGLGSDFLKGGGGAIDILIDYRDADFVITDNLVTMTNDVEGAPIQVDEYYDFDFIIIAGGPGNNLLDASAVTVAGPRITLYGMAGNDMLKGGARNDVLDGGEGDDELRGGAGNDTLRGGAGNDRLLGGAGDDDLRGGLGNDTYVFDKSENAGTDTVTELATFIWPPNQPLQGFADTLIGAGLAGVEVKLTASGVAYSHPNLRVILTHGNTVEYSYP